MLCRFNRTDGSCGMSYENPDSFNSSLTVINEMIRKFNNSPVGIPKLNTVGHFCSAAAIKEIPVSSFLLDFCRFACRNCITKSFCLFSTYLLKTKYLERQLSYSTALNFLELNILRLYFFAARNLPNYCLNHCCKLP